MNNDYRPRNGGGRNNNRRGGNRNNRPRRSGQNQGGYQRVEREPRKISPLKRLINWLFKKDGPEKRSENRPQPRDNRENSQQRRKPQVSNDAAPVTNVEVTSPKLYVGNLSYDAGEGDLFDLFSRVGAVRNVEVVMDRNRKQSKGFGFVEMESIDRAKAAVEQLNRTDFLGRQIVVSGAKGDKRASSTPANGAESPSETSPTSME